MADLEEHAIRRDRTFLVRLVLLLGVGVLFGLFLFSKLTSSETAGCAARTFGGGDSRSDAE